jgi:hypothetical protein
MTEANESLPVLSMDPKIGVLFRSLLQPPNGVQLFCSRYDLCSAALHHLWENDVKITGIDCAGGTTIPEQQQTNVKKTEFDDIAMFRPLDQFHLAFSFFPFRVQRDVPEKEAVQPNTIQDKMMFFKCSEGKEKREIPYHLLGLEQMLKSVFAGGYFGAVLPKRWIGREMRYLQWWNDRAALVCRIKLPQSAVRVAFPDQPEPTVAPSEWELCIWSRALIERDTDIPNSRNISRALHYAMYRYNPFSFPLETLSNEAIDRCSKVFRKHDWWKNSVQLWKDVLDDHSADYTIGTFKVRPHGLSNPKDTYFFNPTPEFTTSIKVVESVDDIKNTRHSVHVKVNRNIKLTCYKGPAQATLLDMKTANNLMTLQDGSVIFKYDNELRYRPFADIKERLLADLENQGLVPCMTRNEYHTMQKRERWLSIQLTPIERAIPVGPAADVGETTTEENIRKEEIAELEQAHLLETVEQAKAANEAAEAIYAQKWSTAYEDIGMKAIFPEIMTMWRRRAEAMNLHRYLFDFQLEDILYFAAHQNLLNGSVMGLGKTRTSLFGMLLRGAQKMLIICPTKLIDTWRDEIDDTVLPYIRQQRRNWQGKMLESSVQVIEWGRDCLKHNLKTFNIISYDKLKATPRDGKFYKCPKCGMLVYSATGNDLQFCPGDPNLEPDNPSRCNNVVKRWRQLCAGDPDAGVPPRRKFYVLCGEDGQPLKKPSGHWREVHPKKINVPNEQGVIEFPLERIKIMDERPPKPVLPLMKPEEHMYKKMEKIQTGWQEDRHGNKTPVYVMRERKSHVAWTFADLIRWQFSHVIADEALYFVNEDAQRTRAMYHLCANNRVAMTGTPMKNKPENILSILNWTFPRIVFPSYRPYDSEGMRRFLEKYRTVVYLEDGKEKPIPKVNNPELFQSEVAPLMLRHVRNEPNVLKDIPRKKIVENRLEVDMDEEHKEYYRKWLAEFAEWWAMMKEDKEGKKVPPGALLTKLTYLTNCSTIPHNMLDNLKTSKDDELKAWAIKIGAYPGKRPTAKMRKAFELVKHAVESGDKTIIFSFRRACLKIGQAWSEKRGLQSMVVDGTVSIKSENGARSKRHQMVEEFRHYNFHTLWAGLGALAEGLNIPEANHGIVMDCGWTPAEPKQGIGRMIRPAQKKTIYATYLAHKGAIDGYMLALCYLKGRSSEEAIDYMEFDDFSTEIIPDIQQYADAIVDGTEEKLKRKMWLAVDTLKRQTEEEGEEEM